MEARHRSPARGHLDVDLFDTDAWRAIAIGLLVLSIARPLLRFAAIAALCLMVIWLLP